MASSVVQLFKMEHILTCMWSRMHEFCAFSKRGEVEPRPYSLYKALGASTGVPFVGDGNL